MKSNSEKAYKAFLKSMLFTAAAIALLVIGFIAAGYFFN